MTEKPFDKLYEALKEHFETLEKIEPVEERMIRFEKLRQKMIEENLRAIDNIGEALKNGTSVVCGRDDIFNHNPNSCTSKSVGS